jgi:hypothetical protein
MAVTIIVFIIAKMNLPEEKVMSTALSPFGRSQKEDSQCSIGAQVILLCYT